MSKLIDKIERVLFGATAQETVDMRTELAARRTVQLIVNALAADDEPQDDDRDMQPPQRDDD